MTAVQHTWTHLTFKVVIASSQLQSSNMRGATMKAHADLVVWEHTCWDLFEDAFADARWLASL